MWIILDGHLDVPREASVPTFLKALPGPRSRPDLKNEPKKCGQTAFRYPAPIRRTTHVAAAECAVLHLGQAWGLGPGPPVTPTMSALRRLLGDSPVQVFYVTQ